MQKNVTYCDICGKEDAYHYSFAYDTERDGAGDIDELHKNVDLCMICGAKQLAEFITGLAFQDREQFADTILKLKRFYRPPKISSLAP